eukprot:jgi/Chrzof1/13861/Cz08g15110.t1
MYTMPCAVGQVVSLAWTTFTGRVVTYDCAYQVVSKRDTFGWLQDQAGSCTPCDGTNPSLMMLASPPCGLSHGCKVWACPLGYCPLTPLRYNKAQVMPEVQQSATCLMIWTSGWQPCGSSDDLPLLAEAIMGNLKYQRHQALVSACRISCVMQQSVGVTLCRYCYDQVISTSGD